MFLLSLCPASVISRLGAYSLAGSLGKRNKTVGKPRRSPFFTVSSSMAPDMANNSDSTPLSYDQFEDPSSEDRHTAATDDKSSPVPELESDTDILEGLESYVFHLVNSLPPEILRGKYAVVPSGKPKRGLDLSLPPISNIANIFDDLASKAHVNGIDEFLEHIGSRELRVATMCSGTESPLLALEMLADSMYVFPFADSLLTST